MSKPSEPTGNDPSLASSALLADGGPRIRRSGSRCGKCYWALCDGAWCQNPDCPAGAVDQWSRIIGLSNAEAQILIQANDQGHLPADGESKNEINSDKKLV